MFSKKHGRYFGMLVSVLMFYACGSVFCRGAEIHFTQVPAYGTYGSLSGQVSGVAYANYKVLVYIYVYGWWNKPTWANPLTSINSDGSWTCTIAGGDSDTLATEIIAFLIPNGTYQSDWQMAGNSSLPSELYFYPYADIHRTPANQAIQFAGHNWAVKVGDDMGPGPNHFSDSTSNVWVDTNGRLHLKITHPNSNWYCSEIISDESFGYGTYVFTVESRLDTLNTNIILGLFTWDTYAPQYHYREIDFEFGTWQNPADDIGQFVIQPWDTHGNRYRYDIAYTGSTLTTTHVMTWRPDGIYFKSYYGNFSLAPAPETIIRDWFYTGTDNPPPGGENVRMNLWLINGTPPTNNQESEIVIKDFQFLTNISDRPGDISNDNAVNLIDLSQMSANWQQTNCTKLNTWCDRTDLNCSGTVDITDLLAFSAYWLQSDSLP